MKLNVRSLPLLALSLLCLVLPSLVIVGVFNGEAASESFDPVTDFGAALPVLRVAFMLLSPLFVPYLIVKAWDTAKAKRDIGEGETRYTLARYWVAGWTLGYLYVLWWYGSVILSNFRVGS